MGDCKIKAAKETTVSLSALINVQLVKVINANRVTDFF